MGGHRGKKLELNILLNLLDKKVMDPRTKLRMTSTSYPLWKHDARREALKLESTGTGNPRTRSGEKYEFPGGTFETIRET